MARTYRPDFYLPAEDLFIEVVGCRGRVPDCERRATLFRLAYPSYRLEVHAVFDWHQRPSTHPGEILDEEFLQPKNMTQRAAAVAMGISLNRLNEIIKGKRGVTADTALRFAKLTKTSPQFWMQLQNAVDLYRAQLAQREMAASK